MIALTKRNLLVFFRDRTAVFFSLLASIIIILLYILFLGDVYTADLSELSNAQEIMDSWVMAGLLATTSATTTMGAFGAMVDDKTKKITKDFYASPLSRRSLLGGYVASAFIIGLILSLITLVLAEAYIVIQGGSLLEAGALLKLLPILLLTDLSNTAMVFFITSFFNSNSAYATASTVMGTLIGFVTGIYLPIGMLPGGVQWVVKLFPTSHAAALLRQILTEAPMAAGFANVPAEYVTEFEQSMGLVFEFGSYTLSNIGSMFYLLGTAILFFTLAGFKLTRKKT